MLRLLSLTGQELFFYSAGLLLSDLLNIFAKILGLLTKNRLKKIDELHYFLLF